MPYADPERRRQAAKERQRKYRATHRELLKQRARDSVGTPANDRRNQLRRERRAADPKHHEQAQRERKRRQERYANDPEYREREAKRDREYRRRKYSEDSDFRERRYRCIQKYRNANRELVTYSNWIRYARDRGARIIPFTLEEWAAKVAYWGKRCWMCGGPWSAIDHVKPISAGGSHMLCNIRPVCKSCNSRKRQKWPLADALGVHARAA